MKCYGCFVIVQGYHNKTMKNQQSIKYNAFRKLKQAFSSKWNAWNVVKMNSKKKHVKHYIWSKYLNSYPWITIFLFPIQIFSQKEFFLANTRTYEWYLMCWDLLKYDMYFTHRDAQSSNEGIGATSFQLAMKFFLLNFSMN